MGTPAVGADKVPTPFRSVELTEAINNSKWQNFFVVVG
jgi:hypothetical protein